MGVREEEHSIGGDDEKQSTNGDNEIEHTLCFVIAVLIIQI